MCAVVLPGQNSTNHAAGFCARSFSSFYNVPRKYVRIRDELHALHKLIRYIMRAEGVTEQPQHAMITTEHNRTCPWPCPPTPAGSEAHLGGLLHAPPPIRLHSSTDLHPRRVLDLS